MSGEVVETQMNSYCKIVEDQLRQVRLNQSPKSLWLTGEERWEYLHLLISSEGNSDADKSSCIVSSFYSQKDGVGNMKKMFLINQGVLDVELLNCRNNFTFWLFLHMFKEHGVNSISFLDSSDNIFPFQSKFQWILIPDFFFNHFLEGIPIIFIYFFAWRQLVVFSSIFSKHVGNLAIDHRISKQKLSFWKVGEFAGIAEFLLYEVDVLDLADVKGVEESHGIDGAERDILFCYYFVHLFKFWWFEVESNLFSNQVGGLFGFLGIGVGPSIGEGELQSVVGILQFQRKFQGMFELIPTFSP